MVETTIEKDESVRKEIVLAAQKLIQKFGLKKTTMNEIAAACGKAKITLYYYYYSLDDVYDAVFHMELENLRIQVNQKVAA
ncbi:MAG: TetR/AcrR family transcriptional regulator, partial [Bacteroidota bacterium]|nr:TetR/AcrR family transcriptional regulator [Bacteroidota bacterium]